MFIRFVFNFSESPARGCSGAQGLTPSGRLDLLLGRKKCPDGNNPQPVVRYMRSVKKVTVQQKCRSMFLRDKFVLNIMFQFLYLIF